MSQKRNGIEEAIIPAEDPHMHGRTCKFHTEMQQNLWKVTGYYRDAWWLVWISVSATVFVKTGNSLHKAPKVQSSIGVPLCGIFSYYIWKKLTQRLNIILHVSFSWAELIFSLFVVHQILRIKTIRYLTTEQFAQGSIINPQQSNSNVTKTLSHFTLLSVFLSISCFLRQINCTQNCRWTHCYNSHSNRWFFWLGWKDVDIIITFTIIIYMILI